MSIDCQKIKNLVQDLQRDKNLLDTALSRLDNDRGNKDFENQQARDSAWTLMLELKKNIKELDNLIIPEVIRNLDLEKQYDSQVDVLRTSKLLERLPNGQEGIIGIDGKPYPIPTFDQIMERIKAKKELLKTKVEQGFTKLQLVPFALSLDKLIEKYKQAFIQADAEHEGINLTDGTKQRLNEDKNNQIYVWDEYPGCDDPKTPVDKQIEYFVQNYDGTTKAARKGKYKSELLEDPANAWQITLIEDLPDLPAVGKDETVSNRKQIEANKTPIDYLKLLQTQKQYQGESGQTPEAAMITYITYLKEQNLVIDDYGGQGKANYLVGQFLSGRVPDFYWYRGDRQPNLDGSTSDSSNSSDGFRPAVEF